MFKKNHSQERYHDFTVGVFFFEGVKIVFHWLHELECERKILKKIAVIPYFLLFVLDDYFSSNSITPLIIYIF